MAKVKTAVNASGQEEYYVRLDGRFDVPAFNITLTLQYGKLRVKKRIGPLSVAEALSLKERIDGEALRLQNISEHNPRRAR